jgi:hypothetical protein
LEDKGFAAGNTSSCSIVSADTHHERLKNVLNQLQFDNLPPLRRQIKVLPKFINPSELKDDITGSIHTRLFKFQTEIEENLDQIQTMAASIPKKKNRLDQHLKQTTSILNKSKNSTGEEYHFDSHI